MIQIINVNHHGWFSGRERISGSYSTQHVQGSIPGASASHDGGQEEVEMPI